ncbi:MAG: hypothetical protein UGF89_08615 [Acutalibacteraceae bacterium]|nr:hypothetical protein [Acutalibacteraceae bacterium]
MTGIHIIDAFFSLLVTFCMLLTGVMDSGEATSTPEVELVREEKLVFLDAMTSGQGVTTDGKYFYTSGSITAFGMTSIAKRDAETMEVLVKNDAPIPQEYIDDYSSDHVGGISYYDGKIYAAVENKAEDLPLVITYDARTLHIVDIFELPNENLPDGIPWCCVDGENGYLYCSQFNEVNEILAFDLETMEFSHVIPLSEQVVRIQGGEVYDGILYLSSDIADSNDDKIMTVDVETGIVEELCTRSLPSAAGNEAEGITVYPMEDGTFIHILDYDKTVGVYLRHYKIVEE